MRELLTQYGALHAEVRELLADPKSAILDIDRRVTARQRAMSADETEHFGVPLGGSLIPWIDVDRGDGTSLEEWKGSAETNKILGRTAGAASPVPIDSICVRIGAMRCHSQSLTIKLKSDVPLADIEANVKAMLDHILALRPATVKGHYFRRATLTSTMGPGLKLAV